jgi:hypothetical protein
VNVQPRTETRHLSTTEFDHWWNRSGPWVEPANQRRGGESGVQLLKSRDPNCPPLYCKRQTGHIYRSLVHPFGRPTVLRELQAYRAFARLGIRTPNLVYCSARRHLGDWQGLLVTEALDGFISLDQWYTKQHNPELVTNLLHQLAATLARLHLARWQHGCCYAKHIFVKEKVSESGLTELEIAVLDLEKSRQRLRARDASRHDLGQFSRHRGSMPEADLERLRQAYQQALQRTAGEKLCR